VSLQNGAFPGITAEYAEDQRKSAPEGCLQHSPKRKRKRLWSRAGSSQRVKQAAH